ncbi:PAS domain-containing protein [Ensifer adhaerens]|uniref:PAS domain-containing protein n=1 Tax=Ensifer adhaerens TaxID=106592 RepID=UPI0015689E35|nr:PAS domain-containing protein [Ensifer adhaerens]
MYIALGPDLRIIYNDAYHPIIGNRHPEAFGAPMREVFSDIWTELDQLFADVLSGTPQVVESTRISTRWREESPSGWFSFSLVPVTDDAGGVCGFTASIFETTAVHEAQQRLLESEERQAFLLKLSDALRPLNDPADVQRTACEVLGEHLKADRVVYAIVRADDVQVDISENYTATGVAPLTGRLRMSDFGERLLARLRLGLPLVVADIHTSDILNEHERSSYGAIGVAAIVGSPLVKQGRVVAHLNVHQNMPRDWTKAEVELITATAERTWDAVERARADTALRQSEAKYRSLFDNMAEGLTVCAVIRDDAGRVEDLVYLDGNDAVERQTGVGREGFVGRRLSKVSEKRDFERWMPLHTSVADTGTPVIGEHYIESTGRWFEFSIYRSGEDELSIFVRDTSDRKRAEAVLRESQERQAFLLTLSDSLRTTEDPVDAMSIAAELFAKHIGVAVAHYLLFNPDQESFDVVAGYSDGQMPDRFARQPGRISDHGPERRELFRRGEPVFFDDHDNRPPADANASRALGTRSGSFVPLLREGRLLAGFSTAHPEPRRWTDAEKELQRDVAERTWAAVERARAEIALRKSEQYFRALVTAGTYSVYRMSPDWKFMFQLDGGTLTDTSEPIENWVDKYIPVEDRDVVVAAIDVAIRTRSVFELEHRVWVANGSIGWVVSRAVPLLDANGEIIEWFGARTVVTERREALEKLRQSEHDYRASLEQQVRKRTEQLQASRDHLKAILDCSQDMIQVFNAVRDPSGEIVDFHWVLNNHTSERLYGPILGQSLLQRNPGVVVEGIFEAFKRVTETGVPEQAEHHYVHEQFDGWFYQSVVKLGDGIATTTKEISHWKEAQAKVARLERQVVDAKLRESEARSQGLIEGLAQAFWEADADGRVVADSPSWRSYTGQSFDEWKDHGWLDAIHPGDRQYAERQWRDAVSVRRMVNAEFRLRHAATNSWRWTNIRAVPLLGDDGAVEKWVGMNLDIHDRKIAEDAVRESEERLKSATEVGRLGLWDWNVETGEVHWSDEHYRMEGYVPGEVTPSYQAWFDRVHPADRAETEGCLRRAMDRRQEYVHEFRVVHPDGSVHWLYGRGRFYYANGGPAVRMIGAMMDVTERREWEDRQAVLVAELQHRTRNLMSVVRSVADMTARSSSNLADFQERFRDRVDALARVQGLLSRLNEHDRVDFDDLIRSELSAMHAQSGRATLSGPRGVRLRSSTVQTLAMALHELATNAVKYGALGQDNAHLSVTWSFEAAVIGDNPMLHIDWHESGVAMSPSDSPRGGGQGRQLIERALPYQLNALVNYELGQDGIRCTIALPVSETSNLET